MSNIYDIIIVGAGPAGSMAAISAAKSGTKVLLLEKHPVIGYPLCCAEAISTTGLTNIIQPRESWIASKIHKVTFHGPNNSFATLKHYDAGFVLERKIFDRDLAKLAAENGVDIRVGTDVKELIYDNDKLAGVEIHQNGHTEAINGKVIIAADGVESMIARKAGIDTHLKPAKMHSAYQYLLSDLDIEPETLEFHFGNDLAPGGYIWIFPKGGNSANVGLGVCPLISPSKKAVMYLDDFIKRRFKRYSIIERMTGGVPSYMADLPLYKDNLLLAGDAARVVDSLTGAGIANALLSGKLAGETAAKMVSDSVSGEMYADAFNEVKRKELKFYYQCREIFVKLTDSDYESILKFTDDLFGEREVTAINPIDVVKKILLAHPRLLKIGRHIIF